MTIETPWLNPLQVVCTAMLCLPTCSCNLNTQSQWAANCSGCSYQASIKCFLKQ